MVATAISWKHLPAPAERENLAFEASYSSEEFSLIQEGFLPKDMEDKWFIYYDDGWLRFHRSWTGTFIYAVKFEAMSDGVRAVESWANRDSEQYRWKNIEYDRQSVRYVIDRLLLKKDTKPPKVPTEYRVHVPLNGIVSASDPLILTVNVEFKLLIGGNDEYGRIVGKLLLPEMPLVRETVSLVGLRPLSTEIPNFPTHPIVMNVMLMKQPDGVHTVLLLEDVVLPSVQEASIVAQHYKDAFGLDCCRY